MIYTNEPANVFYVYLTAYRSTNPYAINEIFTKEMAARIKKHPGFYGSLINHNVEGCYHEAGVDLPSVERTLVVKCTKPSQVAELTRLACEDYDQDAVLQVNSQTHTAILNSLETVGEYPQSYKRLKEEIIGVLTKQDTGSEMYSIINGERWEVA